MKKVILIISLVFNSLYAHELVCNSTGFVGGSRLEIMVPASFFPLHPVNLFKLSFNYPGMLQGYMTNENYTIKENSYVNKNDLFVTTKRGNIILSASKRYDSNSSYRGSLRIKTPSGSFQDDSMDCEMIWQLQ